ncbi:MAG: cysteine desulfurase [Bacilli bacterium]|nr:cysteine desulfurase [Bacilli bacterium]
MIYLDYSATTPVDEEVLDSFVKSSKYFGNPNSLHKLGVDSRKLIDASTKQIASLIRVKEDEIVYTSGASESNNMVIKGMEKYINRGKCIITTELEHSSINEPLKYMTSKGFKIKYVPLKDGIVDINGLENMLDDVCLVSISMVNSETGVRQPIEEIGKILKKYPKILFHTDITQALGKIKFDLSDVDFASFSAHKFFGIKGIGGLYKKNNIDIVPLIHGGKSTTVYRSGTPATSLIVSMAKALRLSYENMDSDLVRINELNLKLRKELEKYDKIVINSINGIDHILNFSYLGIKPETFLHALEEKGVYISTQSACSSGNYSKSVLALTNDMDRASSSLRISISRKTTEEEIDEFLNIFNECYNYFADK